MKLKNREVSLEPDPYWPNRFQRERDLIADASDDGLLGILHVGSTAVPDIPGKPALDIVAIYKSQAALDAGVETLLGEHGFEQPSESSVVIRWEEQYAVFVKLHTQNDEKARTQIAFTRYLADHESARREYSAVKRQAAAEYDDLEAYTKAKSEIVNEITNKAREKGYFEDLPAFV